MDANEQDKQYMLRALEQARMAFDEDEVPIGAVVVCRNKIIGKGYNQTEKLKDITAHAEMLAITAASSHLGSKYLDECTLYITIEPCMMCAGAIRNARLGRIVFGAAEPKTGFSKFVSPAFRMPSEPVSGIMEEECKQLMQDFFRSKRK